MKDQSKPRMDPRKIRTRQLLKDAFIDLMQEMEIEKISVNRLAERSTINRVTFYLHYRDIPDMMEQLANDMAEDSRRVLHQSPAPEPSVEDRELVMWVNLLEHFAEHAKFYTVILGSKRTPIFTDRLLRLLSETVAARIDTLDASSTEEHTGIPRDIAVWYGSAALIGTIVAWLRRDMPYRPLFLAKHLAALLRSNDLVR